MEQERIKSLMKNLGFSDWEINAYWILIKHGEKTALELSRLSKIPRSKTYEVVTRLRRKGLVMKFPAMPTKGITQKFVAIDPKKFFAVKIGDMKEISDFLENLYKNPIEPRFPKINMYTSKEAVKELFYDLAEKSKFFYVYLSDLSISSVLGYSFENILKSMKRKKNYFLLNEISELRAFSKNLRNFLFVKDSGEMNYIICSDRVILDLYSKQHVILEIVSDDAVKTFLSLYSGKMKI